MKSKKIATAALILLILAGTWTRFYHIGRESFRGDEIQTGYFVRTGIGNIIKASGLERSNPPLYWIILYGWAKIFGYEDSTLRIPSALFSILAIWFMFLVGRRLFDPAAGLIAALLTAGSTFHLYYAQDARNYSLLLLLTLFSIWAFLRVIQEGRPWSFFVYGTASILLAYTHLYGLFTIAAQGLFFLLYWNKHRPFRRAYLFTMLTVGTAYLPMGWLLREKTILILEKGFWISHPTLETIVRIFLKYAGSAHDGAWILIPFCLFFLIGIIPSQRTPQSRIESRNGNLFSSSPPKSAADINSSLVLTLLCFSVPIITPFLLSQFMTPIFVYRYTIGASAAFYLLAARGISRLKSKVLLPIAIGFFIAASVFSMSDYFTHPNKEPWRESAAMLAEHLQPEDTVLFYPEGAKKFIEYYHPVQVPTAFLSRKANETQIVRAVESIKPEKGTLWLIMRRPRSSAIPDCIIKHFGENTSTEPIRRQGIHIYRFRIRPSGM